MKNPELSTQGIAKSGFSCVDQYLKPELLPNRSTTNSFIKNTQTTNRVYLFNYMDINSRLMKFSS